MLLIFFSLLLMASLSYCSSEDHKQEAAKIKKRTEPSVSQQKTAPLKATSDEDKQKVVEAIVLLENGRRKTRVTLSSGHSIIFDGELESVGTGIWHRNPFSPYSFKESVLKLKPKGCAPIYYSNDGGPIEYLLSHPGNRHTPW